MLTQQSWIIQPTHRQVIDLPDWDNVIRRYMGKPTPEEADYDAIEAEMEAAAQAARKQAKTDEEKEAAIYDKLSMLIRVYGPVGAFALSRLAILPVTVVEAVLATMEVTDAIIVTMSPINTKLYAYPDASFNRSQRYHVKKRKKLMRQVQERILAHMETLGNIPQTAKTILQPFGHKMGFPFHCLINLVEHGKVLQLRNGTAYILNSPKS